MGKRKLKTRLLSDLSFKKLFASKEKTHITQHFLEDLLGVRTKSVTIKPSTEYSVDKLADIETENSVDRTSADIILELADGTIVTMEMQNKAHKHFTERVVFYGDKAYISNYGIVQNTGEYQLEEKPEESKYSTLKPVISINVLNFVKYGEKDSAEPVIIFRDYCRELDIYHTSNAAGKELKLTVYFQLPATKNCRNKILYYWGLLFYTGSVPADAPDYLHEAASFIASQNMTEEERKVFIDAEKRREIRKDERVTAWEEGVKTGEKRGEKIGKRIGEKKGITTVALNLLRMGIGVQDIADATGLSLNAIKKLKATLEPV